MHLLYIDETGSTGSKLKGSGQDVFVMAGVIVSDEKWRVTDRLMGDVIEEAFDGETPPGFELHTAELLAPEGEGPFEAWPRKKRNQLALDLLEIVAMRHHVLLNHVHKPSMLVAPAPNKDFGFAWDDPWEVSFAVMVTMFEDFLRGSGTGTTSSGLVIVDHEPTYLGVVRRHCEYRRSAGGWQQLRKVIEVGYSVESHSNPLIQLTDLVAFTHRKWTEHKLGLKNEWPDEAVEFLEAAHKLIWPKVKYKMLSFPKLKVPGAMVSYIKAARSPKG